MRLLLDTHIAIWAILQPEKLPADVADMIIDPANEVYVSMIALWEIAIKRSIGPQAKGEPVPPVRLAAEEFAGAGFAILNLSLDQLERVERFAFHHRDPFDRLMVAQSAVEGMTFLTADSQLAAYGDWVQQI